MKKALLGILISVLTIAVIFKLTETSITWKVIFQANLFYLFIAFSLHFLFWFFWALRLKVLTSYLGFNVSIGYSLKVAIASTFIAAITPSSAGGEPLRAKMLADEGVSIGSASAVVLAERLSDAIFFIGMLPVLLLFTGFSTNLGIHIGVAFFVGLIFFLIFLFYILKEDSKLESFTNYIVRFLKRFSGRKAERIGKKLLEELKMFRNAAIELASNSYKGLVVIIFITSIIWISEFLVASAILLSLGNNPEYLLSLTSQVILVIISLAPLTPGASGIAEIGLSYLYSNFVPQHLLGIFIGLFRFITYFLNLIVGMAVNVMLLKSKYLEGNKKSTKKEKDSKLEKRSDKGNKTQRHWQ